MLTWDMLDGVDESTARRVVSYATRIIAPGLADVDGEARSDAIAILSAVAVDLQAARGSRLIKSQAVGPARVDYRDVAVLFSKEDRATLRALCGLPGSLGGPVGSFPPPSRTVSRLWPEGC